MKFQQFLTGSLWRSLPGRSPTRGRTTAGWAALQDWWGDWTIFPARWPGRGPWTGTDCSRRWSAAALGPPRLGPTGRLFFLVSARYRFAELERRRRSVGQEVVAAGVAECTAGVVVAAAAVVLVVRSTRQRSCRASQTRCWSARTRSGQIRGGRLSTRLRGKCRSRWPGTVARSPRARYPEGCRVPEINKQQIIRVPFNWPGHLFDKANYFAFCLSFSQQFKGLK